MLKTNHTETRQQSGAPFDRNADAAMLMKNYGTCHAIYRLKQHQ
jgi:hypothetical protein